MTTTRQTINHQRRAAARPTATPTVPRPAGTPGPGQEQQPTQEPEPARRSRRRLRAALRTLPRPRGPVLAVLLTVLLGCFAGYAHARADSLRAGAADHDNTALTDAARTSQVKGGITKAVDTLFSYDYTDPARTDDAAGGLLTGAAVKQYASMLAAVRADAPKLKLVLTTTVTDCGLEQLDGDRAQLLVFADQRDTTAGAGATSASDSEDSPSMFTVSAVLLKGTWRISSIGTFTG